jgi:hypothetical protein
MMFDANVPPPLLSSSHSARSVLHRDLKVKVLMLELVLVLRVGVDVGLCRGLTLNLYICDP